MAEYSNLDPSPNAREDRGQNSAEDRLVLIQRRACWFIAAMILFLIAISFFIRIDGAVTANGFMSLKSQVKTISHPTGGVLDQLMVRNGDKVKAGETLMTFQTDVSKPSSQYSNQSLDQLLARKARLEAERSGSSQVTFPSDVETADRPAQAKALAEERRLLALRNQSRNSNHALLDERIVQLNQQIGSYHAQISAGKEELALIKPELEGLRDLWKRRFVTINRLNEMERQAVQLKAHVADLNAQIARARSSISEIQQQKLTLDKEARSQAADALVGVNAAITQQQIEIVEADDRLSRAVVKAPVNGIVEKLNYITPGSAVPAGSAIAQIVPDNDRLIIEANVSPADIDSLFVGQKARIMFTALNQGVTPNLDGELIYIEADQTIIAETGQRYFRVRVALSEDARKSDVFAQLKAGTPADVFLQTGSRSLMSYLVKPLMDQINFALRQ